MSKRLDPVHPGAVLREDFLVPMGLSAYAVARAVGVPRTRIERLTREETPITADTALRLAKYLGTTPAFWMNMQAQHDCPQDTPGTSRCKDLRRENAARRTRALQIAVRAAFELLHSPSAIEPAAWLSTLTNPNYIRLPAKAHDEPLLAP